MHATTADRDALAPVTVIEARSGYHRLGVSQIWEYRHLLWFLVLRNLRARYRSTLLGRLWIVLRPALLSVVYVIVFGALLKVDSHPFPYPVFVFAGIVVFSFFASAVTETAHSLINSYSIISKVYYPRLIVPLTAVVGNGVDLVATMAIVGLTMAVYGVALNRWAIVLVPLILVAITLLTLALGLILAAAAVKVRDILVALPVVMRVVIYTMPATYPVSVIPERFRPLYYLNPMSALLQGFRWALMNDAPPPVWALAWAIALSIAALLCGLYWFSRVERTMVDVL